MFKINLYTFIILTLIVPITSVQVFASGLEKSNLKILDVQFEPIQQGKNIVRVNVQNASAQDQTFRIHIYTRSPDYGRSGVGWGTGFFDTIKARETKWTRFAFKIQGPITEATYIQLQFFNPGPAADFDKKKWAENEGWEKWFKKVKYSSSDLEHRKVNEEQFKPASEEEVEAVIKAFEQVQNFIKDKKYEQVWELFTKDYQQAEFQVGFEWFKKAMEPTRLIDSAFVWERKKFVNLQSDSAFEKNGLLRLKAKYNDETWAIDFVKENGQLKIDWMAGYTPRFLLWQNWEERLLPQMRKRSTKHFDIYYFKDSTAQKQIEKIVQQREKGFQEICRFLGKESDVRVCLVLFEDGQSKHLETGHQGMGWAYGNTIVEVYNEKEQLDPYHETTHILMGSFGNPPALFNEGFAVYMSERLGAHALEDLSGGLSTIYGRVRELNNKGEWIDLEELLTYTDIGSRETRPPVSYAEAAAFVKFLIEKYGKDKFLKAYKNLKNSDEKAVQQQNIETLKQIYGKSLTELEKEWEKHLNLGSK